MGHLENDLDYGLREVERMLGAIRDEFHRARSLHSPMNSPHEGYAVLKEEVDEMWDAIKQNNLGEARQEAVQVAAMALAFLMEVK